MTDPLDYLVESSQTAIDPLVCPRGHHSVNVGAERINCETCRNQGRETTSWPKSELRNLKEEQ